MGTLSVKPVTEATWADLEALFEGKGGPSYCWCMPFRAMDNRSTASNADRKAALRSRVEAGVPIGLVGYVDGEPVAWCSLAPRESFVKLADKQDAAEQHVWSVTCFFVRRDHRKTGLSARMLDEALAYAKARGAVALEGYPVAPNSPSYRFMGFLPLFEGRGFHETGRTGTRRHVMRKPL